MDFLLEGDFEIKDPTLGTAFDRIGERCFMVCPCWDEFVGKEAGVIGFQGNRVQRVPANDTTLRVKRKYHYLGQQNKLNQIYLTRNVNFEPFESQKTFSLAEISKDIEAVFKYNIPVIIGSHRANYIGRINTKNRDRNLIYLKQLLDYIVSKYEDVEFMSSDELVKLIQDEKRKY